MKRQLGTLLGFLAGIVVMLAIIAFLTFLGARIAHGQTVAAKPESTPKSAIAAPPLVTVDLEIAFANADRDLANAKLALKELEIKRDQAAQALISACPSPWILARDPQTQRFRCAEAPKDVAKK